MVCAKNGYIIKQVSISENGLNVSTDQCTSIVRADFDDENFKISKLQSQVLELTKFKDKTRARLNFENFYAVEEIDIKANKIINALIKYGSLLLSHH